MFRQVSTVAWVVLVAVGSFSLMTSLSGCSDQAEPSKPDAATRKPATPETDAREPAGPDAGLRDTVEPDAETHELGVNSEPQKVVLKETAVDLGKGIKLEMLLIPAGEFLMGAPDSDMTALRMQKPRHQVRITKPFSLGKYLVTQEQWKAVMGKNPSQFKGAENPVEMVSWEDCQQFLTKLNASSGTQGGTFVLPTEAQWDYACRAGSKARYCFGNDESKLGEYAWYFGNAGGKPHPVGEKKPNAWGLYDMHGNVWEYCQDWYDGSYYAKSPTDDPTGPATGSYRVMRGGSFHVPSGFCRSPYRSSHMPGGRAFSQGFRVAQVPADK